MSLSLAHPRLSQLSLGGRSFGWPWVLVAAALLCAGLAALWAQVEGDRGIAPIASSSDITVTGIEVDVRADNAEQAREKGWREAQRKAWDKINGPDISQQQLESLVSSVVIQDEKIGPRRYIATLAIVFDRARSQSYLGGEQRGTPSAPMLLIPVTMSGGTFTVYETRNPWQRAWAEFNPGNSRIDYVRPSGAGGDSLLITYGQTGRRSRSWWNAILDQFSAADVLIPVARLEYQWPGGPVRGSFTARYGPDSRYLDSFEMTADSPSKLPDMLDQAVQRFDRIFEQALVEGKLRPDPTLTLGGSGEVDPALMRLIEIGRAIQEREAAVAAGLGGLLPTGQLSGGVQPPEAVVVSSYVVQFTSPDAASIDATLASVRATQGVRGAATTSIAIGGTSVMTVSYGGSLDQLAAALRARGYNVRQGSNAIAISR